MGQKINPFGFRLGISKDWHSRWFSDKKTYANSVLEDYRIRKLLEKKFEAAGLKSIEIERSVNEISITVKVSKPGMVIGKAGAGVEDAEKEVRKITKSKIKKHLL